MTGHNHQSMATTKMVALRDLPIYVMLVPNIPEEPDLALRYEHGHAECMYRCISKSLIIEASASIEPLEIHIICFSAKEIEVSNFKV